MPHRRGLVGIPTILLSRSVGNGANNGTIEFLWVLDKYMKILNKIAMESTKNADSD